MQYISGKLPSEIYVQFELVNHKDHTKNIVCECTGPGAKWVDAEGKHKSLGYQIISHKDMLDNKDLYFPDGQLRFIIKLVLKSQPQSPTPYQFNINWQHLHDSMKHSDIVFKTSDNKGVPAHKIVLIAQSEVFDAMFSHETTEKETGVIDATDLHSDVVREMLRFIYCEAYFVKLKVAKGKESEVYYAAEKYQLEGLKKYCVESIQKNLNTENILENVVTADMFKLDELFSNCLLMIYA